MHEAVKFEVEQCAHTKHRTIGAPVPFDPFHELLVVSDVLAVEAEVDKVE